MARSKEYGIKVWFWPRGDPLAPPDVRSDGGAVNPDKWGKPAAYFPTGANCDYEEHFDAHRIVFDLTFCVRRFSFPAPVEVMCSSLDDFRVIGLVPIRIGRKAVALP
jgi:hypothetical protein